MNAEFIKIKRPEELLNFMKAHGRYAFPLKKNGKLLFSQNWEESDCVYYLQSPTEILASMTGLCWEFAELARFWFVQNGYKNKVFFMYFFKEGTHNLPSHSFVVYFKDGKYIWFEYAFAAHRGTHEFASLNLLLEAVRTKLIKYAVDCRGAIKKDIKHLKIFTYNTPPYGCNDEEFIQFISENGTEIDLKEEASEEICSPF